MAATVLETALILDGAADVRAAMAAPVERLGDGERALAILVRGGWAPTRTTFLTTPEHNQQLGFIVYGAGEEIPRHVHKPLERRIVGTCEVVFVRQGRCDVDLYDDDRRLVATRELAAGDTLIILAGGHGFRMREDTVLMEVKQGPYTGLDEKERF